MTKNMKLVWRLGKLPSVEELRELVKDKIITNEEAKEILFSSETEETKDLKSLEAEVKFFKDLVEQMARTRTSVIESIKYIERPKQIYPWYNDNITWCANLQTGMDDTQSGTILNFTN